LLLQPCNQQGHFSFSVAVLPLFRLSSKIFRIFRQEAKNTRVPTLGYSGATHNTALLGGRRVRGFVDIEPIVRPCP
jgi:type II secretory ATPase GspE/PulE/Tfp pilus assembly ATPase PilB-like protein